jgi:hypothetical protein
VIRARAGRSTGGPVRLILSAIAGVLLLAACGAGPTSGPADTARPGTSAAATGTPAGSDGPTATPDASPTVPPGPGGSPTATVPGSTPGAGSSACSGSDANREFFRQAAASMSWPVYCAALPDGWILETGAYRLRDGGRLEVTYRGPGDAHLSIVEGNVCAGADVEACAPRDAVIGPAPFGDLEGELGRLANGLALDVDRGANPSWRATGVGISEDDFRALGAALTLVEG